MDMFAKLKKTASIVAVLLGCISLCACENSDSSKVTTASQSTVTSYNSNQNYVASQTEIVDDETEGIVWAVLSNWKGIWHFSSYYDSLESMIEGI